MQAVGLGVFGGAAEGAGGEFCLAEEEAVVGGGVSTFVLFIFLLGSWVWEGRAEETHRLSDSSLRTSLR